MTLDTGSHARGGPPPRKGKATRAGFRRQGLADVFDGVPSGFENESPCAGLFRRLAPVKASDVPVRIPIAHDDHHASRIRRLADGRQFFVTTPFVPAIGSSAGREFVAVYLFDAAGALLEARIDDFGVRSEIDADAAHALLEERVAELGVLSYGDIEVQPFSAQRFGTTFGLILRPPDDDDDGHWSVEMHPGNYMAFFEPWEGDYDT